MTEKRVVLASPHSRHDVLEALLQGLPGITVHRIRDRHELTLAALRDFKPAQIFFPHWSWLIPAEVHENFDCVVFHMTDLPFGRGGSPLQNLVVRGVYETHITALKCVAKLDAGPVFLKRPLSLHGTAEEILMRATQLIGEMIVSMLADRPEPVPQEGEVVTFSRRRPEDGNIAGVEQLQMVFDMIRMLDGDGYPPGFIETEHLRIEFSRASLKRDAVLADVRIMRKSN